MFEMGKEYGFTSNLEIPRPFTNRETELPRKMANSQQTIALKIAVRNFLPRCIALLNRIPIHCDPGMELIPKKNENSSISYLIILSYGRDTVLLKKTNIFQIGVVSPEL